MDTVVDAVGCGEAVAPDVSWQNITADPVIYQLVQVDDVGILVPAPAEHDEVMNKSNTESPDSVKALEGTTSYLCHLGWENKTQSNGSEGQSLVDIFDVEAEKPNLEFMSAMNNKEADVQHEDSNFPIGIDLEPNFSLLNGEIDLDNLSVQVLQETFKATFGRKTHVKDKMWLKRRIIMGLTNSCDFSTTTLVLIDNRVVKKGKKESRKTTECSVSVNFAETSEVGSHERHACSDKQNGTEIVGIGMQTKSCFQENCDSKDADPGQRLAKRVRKPTKRFIEEFSGGESKDSGAKLVSLVKHDSKLSDNVCERPVHNFGMDGKCLLREDSLGGSGIRVPYVSRIRRSRPRENFMSLMEFDPSGFENSSNFEKDVISSCKELENEGENDVLESSMHQTCTQEPVVTFSERDNIYMEKKTIQLKSDSEPKTISSCKINSDDVAIIPTANGGMRRKHHRPWSLSEVVMLVEGVAKYGAGRWSVIKRVSFSSYSYRTSVDLKDKWRNLLRASLAESPPGNGILNVRKQASVHIPVPILSRVRELANMQSHVTPILSSG